MRALRWRGFWLGGGAVLLLLVAYLCLRPSGAGEPLFLHADKWAHFLAFAALGVMFLALVERRHYGVVCAALLVFGAAIEVAQFLMPYGRSAEWWDLVADGVGVLVGLAASLVIRESWLQRIEGRLGGRG